MNDCSINTNPIKYPVPEEMFCEYYNELRQQVYTYLLGRTKNADLASDLCQDVFLKFWTLKDMYRSIGDAKAYLMQMAKNALRDRCRKNRNINAYVKRSRPDVEVSRDLTEAMFDERELQRKLQQAILDLSRQRRIVFVLSKMEGWSREKIARTLGVSQLTVKVTLQCAIKEVRKRCRPG